MKTNTFDVVVVGAGISGLTAAAAAATNANLRVALVTTGPGSFVFGSGWLRAQDVLDQRQSPELSDAISFFCQVARLAGCPYGGDLSAVRHLPSLLGEFHSVALAPTTVWQGEPHATPTAIVGISGLSSFDPNFLAERLNDHARRSGLQPTYVAGQISLAHDFAVPLTLIRIAQRFDRDPSFRAELGETLRGAVCGFERILVPGMLGMDSDEQQRMEFEAKVHCIVSEMSTLPPSITTLRVFRRLMAYLQNIGVELYQGFPVSKLEIQGGLCTALEIASPGRPMILRGGNVILTTGLYAAHLLGGADANHDEQMHPLDSMGNTLARNVFVGGSLSHRGLGGDVAGIVTGYRAGMLAAAEEACFAKR